MNDQEKTIDQQPLPGTGQPPMAGRRPGVDRIRPKNQNTRVPNLDDRDFNIATGGKVSLSDADLERDLERDLEDAMANFSKEEMAKVYGDPVPQKRADPKAPKAPRMGKVMLVRGKDVFVDVGGRSQGVMSLQQFSEGPPEIGTEVEVHIEGVTPDGLILLAMKGAAVEADWSTVAVGMTVEARITETNKGGVTVEVNGIRGFMPISQLDLFRVEDATSYVGQRLLCMVTEVDREDRNLLVSRRALLEKEREANREKFWQEVAVGQIREGIVRMVRPFGAFIDVGGADGLLPIGEMSWSRVKSAEDVVKAGDRVRVIVLKLEHETRKMTLGLRQLTASPWDQAALNYPPGSIVRAKVTKLMDFGAFAEVEPGVEGLIHISELAPGRVNRVNEVVKPEQEVVVKVLTTDVEARKMSLSIKQALKAPEPPPTEPTKSEEDEEELKAPPPKKYSGPLRGGVGGKLINPKE
jgi:small subunit ribosomal protein S1